MIGRASAERPTRSSTSASRAQLTKVWGCSGPSSGLAACLAATSSMKALQEYADELAAGEFVVVASGNIRVAGRPGS